MACCAQVHGRFCDFWFLLLHRFLQLTHANATAQFPVALHRVLISRYQIFQKSCHTNSNLLGLPSPARKWKSTSANAFVRATKREKELLNICCITHILVHTQHSPPLRVKSDLSSISQAVCGRSVKNKSHVCPWRYRSASVAWVHILLLPYTRQNFSRSLKTWSRSTT